LGCHERPESQIVRLGVLQKEEVNGQSCDRGRSEGKNILNIEAEVSGMPFYRGITAAEGKSAKSNLHSVQLLNWLLM